MPRERTRIEGEAGSGPTTPTSDSRQSEHSGRGIEDLVWWDIENAQRGGAANPATVVAQMPDAEHPVARPGGPGGQLAGGLLDRIWPRASPHPVARAAMTVLAGALMIGALAVVAVAASEPLIFPSLGPTAYVLLSRPHASISAPRNIVLGHGIGALAGGVALAVFGLLDAPVSVHGPVSWPRAGAAALSVGMTVGSTTGLGVSHPPAAATALVVSLGFISRPGNLLVMMGAVVFLAVLGVSLHRAAGLRTPAWSPNPHAP